MSHKVTVNLHNIIYCKGLRGHNPSLNDGFLGWVSKVNIYVQFYSFSFVVYFICHNGLSSECCVFNFTKALKIT